ncbi:MAG: RNA methyltransferase [Phycisphaerales bacterium]|nr:RNA methyltransferase [Phycisphaerales bacterium]
MKTPEIVSSFDDPKIDAYRNITDADLRGRKHLFMCESEMVVRRLLKTDWNIHSLFLSPTKYEQLSSTVENCSAPIYVADVHLMTEIVGFHIHRGALAAVHRPEQTEVSVDNLFRTLKGRDKLSLLLAQRITNVDNMGALFRNAAAFGVDALLFDHQCCDPLYRKAIRVSMGHTLSMPWAITDCWEDTLHQLKTGLDVQIIGCETGGRAVPLWDVQFSDKRAFVMGEEKSGLSPTSLRACDAIAEIPMANQVPSINVSVASAVALYDSLRRDSFDKG